MDKGSGACRAFSVLQVKADIFSFAVPSDSVCKVHRERGGGDVACGIKLPAFWWSGFLGCSSCGGPGQFGNAMACFYLGSDGITWASAQSRDPESLVWFEFFEYIREAEFLAEVAWLF